MLDFRCKHSTEKKNQECTVIWIFRESDEGYIVSSLENVIKVKLSLVKTL